ncbi:hypothetical protein Bbelb_266210 [Branchiostoma belcheri]|nr:hypothetical protein Bbelb_266210 [Branchiostoma belcheri]
MKLGGGRGSVLPIALFLLLCVTPWCDAGKRWYNRPRKRVSGPRVFQHGHNHGIISGRCHHGRMGGGRPRKIVAGCRKTENPVFLPNQKLVQIPSEVPAGTTCLALIHNSITSLGPQSLARLPALEFLLLPANGLTYIASEAFSHVPKLKALNLAKNQLTDFPWGHMQAQSSLTFLDLNGNHLTSLPADAFKFLPAMTELLITNNNLMSIPRGIFDDVPRLTTVRMSQNPWKCDCDFLVSYKTLPATIARMNPRMTCASPPEHCGRTMSTMILGSGCIDASKGIEKGTGNNGYGKYPAGGGVLFLKQWLKQAGNKGLLQITTQTFSPSRPQAVQPTVRSTLSTDDQKTPTENGYQNNPDIGKVRYTKPSQNGYRKNPDIGKIRFTTPTQNRYRKNPDIGKIRYTTPTQNGYRKNPDIGKIAFTAPNQNGYQKKHVAEKIGGPPVTTEEDNTKKMTITKMKRRDGATTPADADLIIRLRLSDFMAIPLSDFRTRLMEPSKRTSYQANRPPLNGLSLMLDRQTTIPSLDHD